MKNLFCVLGALLLSVAHAQTVGTFVSLTRTFSTASYWVEGPSGLVMIDTQFLPNEGIQAVEFAEKSTGKKVTHAIVLHPNPDKFNGTEAFQKRGIKVLTSAQVIDAIPAVHVIRTGWFAEEFKPDYPPKAAMPDSFGATTMSINLNGTTLTLHVMGAGCSAAHVVVQTGDAVFVGDLINPENHAWLELGTIGSWLDRLTEIKAMSPRRIYPGRGKAGGVELVEKQAAYLRFVRDAVRAAKPEGNLGMLRKYLLQTKIESTFPDLGYPLFMRDGLEAVWKQEAARR